jgi:carboxyl-terminal processing protease
MKRKLLLIPFILIAISVILSACSGLLPLDEETVNGEYGPAYSTQEHQTRTFDTLWKDLQDNYIYYQGADLDWDSIHNEYIDRINGGLTQDEFTSMLKELETRLPDESFVYQPRAERIESDIATSTTYDGIGAFVGFQEEGVPHIVILAVIDGSPAEQAGLKAHDSIFSIDGNPVLLEEGLSVVERIRGPAGSSVSLNVQTPGSPKRIVDVERAKLTTTGKLEAFNIIGTDFGYLLFPPIGYQGLDQDVFNALQTLATNRKLKGVILDLRVVNSSQNWPLDTLFTMFHDGKIGELYNRKDKQLLEVEGQDVVGSQTMPLVILVGKNTNGFAEIFAGCLQMYKRAVIVGEQTPGEVEKQSAFYLPDGSRIFVESTSFRLSNGNEIGNTGITPDITVPVGWDDILPEQDPVLDQAIAILEKTK